MAISPISEFLRNIRRAALRRDEAGLTDGQLLDVYVRSHEEAAFAARAMAMKRKAREKQVKDMPEPALAEQNRSDDLLPLLDQELGRLPDTYRTAIVLCDLQGRSYKEAARQLGCPEGTLAARLTRGRAMLAKRLARPGLAVAGEALAMVLSQGASAGVPASVLSSTIKVANLFAAGQAAATGAVSVKVAALTEGVLRTMLLSKLKIATTVLLTAAALSGTAGLVYQTQAREKISKAEATVAERADPGAEVTEKDKAVIEPDRKVITTAGVHELCDGKWRVEALQVEGGGDVEKDKNRKGFLRMTITNVPNHKLITFNRPFYEKWPWFVFAPSSDTVLYYDGDKEMNLVTLSRQGTIESETTLLPKEWVALLDKQRPRPPVPVQMIQERGADGKVRLRPAKPTDALKPYPGAKDGKVIPPPNR
jgi:RNA polymerase sigma factor (sigma-70 family)